MTVTASVADYQPIHQAMSALAGVCDYATERDNVGFNGTDAWLGHALASMALSDWDESSLLTAWDMIRKYKRQLERDHGIVYDDLPVPPGAEELLAERRQEARERSRALVRERREEQYRRATSFVICEGEGEEVILGFPFNWDLVAEAKKITGRKYEELYKGYKKINRYPFASLPLVIAFADKHGIEVTPEVRILVEVAKLRHAEALKAAEEAAAARAAMPHVRLDERGRLVVDKDRDQDTNRLNAALRELNRGYSTWDREAQVHRPPVRNPEAVKKIVNDFQLTVSPEAQALLDGELDRQAQNLRESSQATAEPLGRIPGLDDSVTIMPQQWPAIRHAVKHRRTWLGDDMGLGKSLSALSATAYANAYPLVIVCKPDLVLNWTKELARFPHVNVFVAEGQKPTAIPADTDVVIIGSAVLTYWTKKLNALCAKALILDEGQIAKEQTTGRTKAVMEISEPIVARDGMVLILTGTAIMNRAKELLAQLEIMGQTQHFGGPGAYLVRHCVSEENQHGRKFDGSHHLDEIYNILRTEGLMIRRTKEILNLPAMREHQLHVSLSDLDPKLMSEYLAAEADVVKFLGDKAAQLAKRYGVNPDSARVKAAMKAQAAEHLVMINTLRVLLGQAKTEYAKRWVQAQVDAGKKVMVAAHHKEVTGPLAKAFGGLKIVGGQTAKSKETDKFVFQNNPGAKVITLAIEAGGTGHTLTAAHVGLMVELCWTPGGKNQLRDRIHRIGLKHEADFHILLARGTVDDYMFSILEKKQAYLDAVLDGKFAEGIEDDDKSIAAEVAWKLAMQGQNSGGRA